MVDTTKADTVRAALIAGFQSIGDTDWAETIRTIPVAQVPFSYVNLMDWMNYLSIRLMSGKSGASVYGVGADIHGVHVDVDVGSEADLSALENWAASADIPCGLVMIGISGPMTALWGPGGASELTRPVRRR
jgi:hypothetical protein